MDSYAHAQSAAKHWGGTPDDYRVIEEFIDSSKLVIPDFRHRAMYHHTYGAELARCIFGPVITITTKQGGTRTVSVKDVVERHVIEDLGWMPTPADYLNNIPLTERWISGRRKEFRPIGSLGLVAPDSTEDAR